MRRFVSLRRRADYTRLRRFGRRISTKNLTLYRSEALTGDVMPVVGITVSKLLGKAVTRNRLRRRLSAIVHEALREGAAMRLLIVPRPAAALLAYADLRAEVTSALAAG